MASRFFLNPSNFLLTHDSFLLIPDRNFLILNRSERKPSRFLRFHPSTPLGKDAKNSVARGRFSPYLFPVNTLLEKTTILSKTKELCAQIAEDAQIVKLQADVERFLADDAAKLQYQTVHEKGEELHHKQHAGVELGAAEIKAFEDARDALFDNKVAADFMDAQRTLESIQKDIQKYVSLTLELGHVPTDREIEEANSGGGGCCGGGGGGGGCCG